MKRHTVDKIRAALAARTPGTWRITERGYGGVVVRLGDPELSPAFLAAEAKERADELAKWQAKWDAASDEERAELLASGWTRDDPHWKTESDYYGGALIGESIRTQADAELIAAAPAWLAQVVADADRVEAVTLAAGLDGDGLAWLADGGPPPAGLEVSEVITALARAVVAAQAAMARQRAVGHVGVVYPAAERCRLCGAADRSRCGHFVGGGAG